MKWIDKKYINLVSHKLEGFQWQSEDVAVCRCPICGDSKKNKRKRRGTFLGQGRDSFSYYCHNCNASMSLSYFLYRGYNSLFSEYNFEKLKNKYEWKTEESPKSVVEKKTAENDIFSGLISISDLPEDHKARQYILGRKIPEKYHDKLFYCQNYKLWAREKINPDLFKDTKDKEDERIVIPFLNKEKKVLACQGRYIGPDAKKQADQRYFTQKIGRDNILIFGLDSIDFKKLVKVVEGPFDSMFLKNSIAVAGSALKRLFKIDNDNLVYIFDNQPRNREIVQLMEEAISLNKRVFIPPSELDWKTMKDINEMYLNGYDVDKLIEENIYQGIFAQLKFADWKKI